MSVAYDPIAFNQAGSRRADTFFNDVANTRAARGLESGNYAQAIGALAGVGNLQGVADLQDRQAQQQLAQRQSQDDGLARQVAFTKQATTTLERALVDGQDPIAAFDSFAPAFTQLGVPPEQQQQYRAALAADPANFLATVKAATADQERKLNFQKAGDSLLVFEEGNPDPVNRFEAPRRAVVSGGVSFDPVTGQPIADARRPEYIEVEGADGRPQIVAIGPDGQADIAFEGEGRPTGGSILSAAEIAAAGLAPGTVAQRNANGQVSILQAGPEAANRNRPTEAQNKDSFNANRMADSGSIISRLEGEGFDYGASQLTGGQLREGGRSYDAAAREWADSLLRLTTGAAATKAEVDSALISYFPRPGDSAAVRQQKASRRQQVEADALARGAGGAAARDRTEPTQQPRVRFSLTPAQQRAWSGITPSGNRGARTNPIVINPQQASQSFNNVPRGGYFITPDGQLRGPKP